MSRNVVLNPRQSGELVVKLSKHVTVCSAGIATLANLIVKELTRKSLTTNFFTQNDVHPLNTDKRAADWIFLVDTLNFCFWSEQREGLSPWMIEYNNKKYTGYFALCAAINKAKDSGKWGDINNPAIYSTLTESDLAQIMKGPPYAAQLGLIKERVQNLKEVGRVLSEKYDGSFENVIKASDKSAVKLVNIVVEDFPCFKDEAIYKGHHVSLYKRAQILVGDIWNCFEGKGLGEFVDIGAITMFADYRVPQSLIHFGILKYSEDLLNKLKAGIFLESGSEEEVEIRGCSIYAVDLLTAEVQKLLGEAGKNHQINAILLDNFLWEFRRKAAKKLVEEEIPFHKTLCIYY